MHAWAIVGGVLTFAIWAYLAVLRGGFWRLAASMGAQERRDSTAGNLPPLPDVVAVVPARNEAAFIGESVRSLLRQSFAGSLRVIVIDDDSSDGTAAVARAAAAECGAAERLSVLSGSPPPPSWTGKLWAVQQGIAAADEYHPEFLLLTDADIRHAPESVAQLVEQANGGRDLVSHMVRLHCSTVAERLLIPPFVYFFFLLYPPAWIADPRRRTAGAAGGCMLLRREALERAGGIAAVQSEIIDDCALAKTIKKSGGRVWLGLASATESLRPYGSFAEIGKMISRTAFNQLGHSIVALLGCVAGLVITFLFPPALLLSGAGMAAAGAAAAWLLMSITYAPMVRFHRLNLLWAATLPLAALFYLGATVHSALRFWSGQGGEWKGRVQDPALKT